MLGPTCDMIGLTTASKVSMETAGKKGHTKCFAKFFYLPVFEGKKSESA